MEKQPNHGEAYGALRRCDTCNTYHGFLFMCRHYNDIIRKQVEKDAKDFKKQLKKKERGL